MFIAIILILLILLIHARVSRQARSVFKGEGHSN